MTDCLILRDVSQGDDWGENNKGQIGERTALQDQSNKHRSYETI